MFKQFLIGSLLILGACSTPPQDTTEVQTEYQRISFANVKATDAERNACEAVGGIVRPAGMLGGDHCIQNLPDAGTACSDASDCLARCVIEGNNADGLDFGAPVTGVCEATDEMFGCTALVNNGQYEGTLCVD